MTPAAAASLAPAASLTLDLLMGAWASPKMRGRRTGNAASAAGKQGRSRRPHPPLDIIRAINQGFAGKSVLVTSGILDLTQEDIAHFMDVTEKTVRTLAARRRLDATMSDKLFRLVKGYVAALQLFEDREDTMLWLKSPSEALGGAVPLELLTSGEGEALVHYELAQMRYGHPV